VSANDNDKSLAELIDLQIQTQGPMSIASFMGLCLTHPAKGYYRKADPFGTAGDFVTAPEISQMFGELIGFFFVNLWQQMDELIETLDARPDHRFTLDGQAIVIEDYLEIRPDMEERLRALLRSGRLETGPSYVLPDEFLAGAESLVRNLLHGRAVCEGYGAAPAPVGYLPDSFGHPAQLRREVERLVVHALTQVAVGPVPVVTR
jgi:hypothetical protein